MPLPLADVLRQPAYGQQEQGADNGHFESTRYHLLPLFNREGDCLAAKLRPGNVHSANAQAGHLRGAGEGRREVRHPHPG